MSVKTVLVLCTQKLLIQSTLSQCGSGGNYGAGLAGYGWGEPAISAPLAGNGLACGADLGYGAGLGYGVRPGYGGVAIEAIPTSGGALPVSSSSAVAPSGLSVASENVFEGALSVSGELPFLSAVTVEGVLPSGGAGVVSHSYGNGVTAIESITPSYAAYAPSTTSITSAGVAYAPGRAAFAPASAAIAPGLGYGGLAGRGCGCDLY